MKTNAQNQHSRKQVQCQLQPADNHQLLRNALQMKYMQTKDSLIRYFKSILDQWSQQSMCYCLSKYQDFSKQTHLSNQQTLQNLLSQISQVNKKITQTTQKSLINIRNLYLKTNIHFRFADIDPQKQTNKIALKRKSLSCAPKSNSKKHSYKTFSIFQSTKNSFNRKRSLNSKNFDEIFGAHQLQSKNSLLKSRNQQDWINKKYMKKQKADGKLKKIAMQKFNATAIQKPNSAVNNIMNFSKTLQINSSAQSKPNKNQIQIEKKLSILQQKIEGKLNNILAEIRNTQQGKNNLKTNQRQEQERPVLQQQIVKKVQLKQRSILIDQKKVVNRSSIKNENHTSSGLKKSMKPLKNNTVEDEQGIQSVAIKQIPQTKHLNDSQKNQLINQTPKVSQKIVGKENRLSKAFNEFFRVTKKVKLPISENLLSIMSINIKNTHQQIFNQLEFGKQPVPFTEQQAKKVLLDGLQDLNKLLALKCKQDKKQKLALYTQLCLNCIKVVILNEEECNADEMTQEIQRISNKLNYYHILQY